MSPYRILRDDGGCDGIAGQQFASYDEAHALLERYYADLCCSDEREYYRIEQQLEQQLDPQLDPESEQDGAIEELTP